MRIAFPIYIVSPWSVEVVLRLGELGHEVHVTDFALTTKKVTGYFVYGTHNFYLE